MGGRGAGFSNANNNSKSNEHTFEKVSLDGKTGTEKQRAYAESLLENLRNNAMNNGVSGYFDIEGKTIKRYVSENDAEAMRAAYRFASEAVKNRKTYGEVIDLLKNKSIFDLQDEIKTMARNKNKSATKLVEEIIAMHKKRKQ